MPRWSSYAILAATGLLITAVKQESHAQTTIPASGIINTIAGNGVIGYAGDGAQATTAEFHYPERIAVDTYGNIYIADYDNNRIRKVTAATGVMSTIAGNGVAGFKGDGGPATAAELSYPAGVAVDSLGNVYESDYGTNRVRKITATTGVIATIAGTGVAGWTGDGSAASGAELNEPVGLAVDINNDLYIADYGNHRIRKITVSTMIISTVAGDGVVGSTGDGGVATSAELSAVFAVSVDTSSNIYIPDHGDSKIRKVSATTGYISTIAGTGTAGYTGNGGLATSAQLNSPSGLCIDQAGNVYFSDTNNSQIRMITAATGTISAVAGTGTPSFTGDNGPATKASLGLPQDVAIDPTGNLYIVDYNNQRIRSVGAVKTTPTIGITLSATTGNYGSASPTATATVPQGTGLVTFTSSNGWSSGKLPVASGTVSTTINTAGWNAGAYTITASFTGNNAYYPASKSTTLTVVQAPAGITWKTPAPIQYGTPLSGAQLNAASAVTGVFTYNPAAGAMLLVGSHILTVTFTPNNTADYSPSSTTVILVVNKATPSITWPTPSAIKAGTALSYAQQLNATSKVAGQFVYSPSAGTIPATGTDKLSVTFTPTDTADYVVATAQVILAVFTTNTLSLAPTSGIPGTTVIITNSGYGATQGASTISFNGSTLAVIWTATSITLTVPQTTVAGIYTVGLSIGGTVNTQQTFTVIPKITGIAFTSVPPIYQTLSGPPQVGFVISGLGFGPQNINPVGSVTLGGVQLPVVAGTWSNTQIVVQVPAAFPKNGPAGQVVVTYAGLASLDQVTFSTVCPLVCPQGPDCQ